MKISNILKIFVTFFFALVGFLHSLILASSFFGINISLNSQEESKYIIAFFVSLGLSMNYIKKVIKEE